MKRYNPAEIETKWQRLWDDSRVYQADLHSSKPKYMAMSMFNYPSGAGIHIGHAMNYTISDVKARFKRQQGYESYHPVGWDAFGLPAENYAIKSGVSPQKSMAKIIPDYHRQYKAMGWSNDWSREIATHEPEYYKWTQWIFAEMYRAGLAYQDSRLQWWCEKDKTVLSNEQVIDGKCWRHDSPSDPLVKQKKVKQWFFKITDYADELLEAIDELDWTDSVKIAQKNWIGRSIGAEVIFEISTEQASDATRRVTVFTTRPDTLYGVTFLVLAPEHELVATLTIPEQTNEMNAYIERTRRLSEIERQAAKEKTGVFTGSYAINPLSGEKIPVWVADYVLTGYGTGAIMAVPAHDERDYEFATKFDLPVIDVVAQTFGEKLDDTTQVEGVVVIAYDPATKNYLSLKNGSLGWLVSGGREADESFAQAAARELLEEAGIREVADWLQLGAPVYSYYYNDIKRSNHRSFGYNYLAIVDSSKTLEQHQKVHEDFQPLWRDFDATYADIEATKGGVEHWLNALERAKAAVEAVENGKTYMPDSFHGDGVLINSGAFNGASTAEARELIVQHLERLGKAHEKVNYKMRDWSVSRQRYWGAPIPVVYCERDGTVLVPDDQLPVVLPELNDFQPSGDGRSALARANDWLNVTCPTCGGPAQRETDTLDTYLCSSWYMWRYLDPHNNKQLFDSDIVNKWAPVDFYNGGDHATAHLLYARFVTRFLTKRSIMHNPEPFAHMLYNGKVTAHDGTAFSKSKGNGIDPLEIINSGYGADALRTYLMFAAPLEFSVRWDPQGVPATHRFLSRVWNLTQEYLEATANNTLDPRVERELTVSTNRMVKKITEDLEANRYNTAIAAAMAQTNLLYKLKVDCLVVSEAWCTALTSLLACIAPFAPHMSDELWQQLGAGPTVQKDSWPTWDEAKMTEDTMTIAVQINGKVRAELQLAKDSDQASVEAAALAHERVQEFMVGTTLKRIIYVPGRLINIVAM